MQDLKAQEQFELEVLDRLNSHKLLSHVIFIGGTMLRLCHGLNRFSVDLDFWSGHTTMKPLQLFKDIRSVLASEYVIKDSARKFFTLLFEIKSKKYPRALKIEIRKQPRKIKTGQAIAYSRYSTTQVILRTASLEEMMAMKIEAFLSRKAIRDAFDMEFLLKKGVPLKADASTKKKISKSLQDFKRNDYQVRLGSLLEVEERKYYSSENFRILKSALRE